MPASIAARSRPPRISRCCIAAFTFTRFIRLSRGDATADRLEASRSGIRLLEFPIDPNLLGTRDATTVERVEKAFAAFADTRNEPVYLYCDHGRDRTGYVVGLYRLRVQHWPLEAVERELEHYGHGAMMRWYLPKLTAGLRREAAADRNRGATGSPSLR